MVEATDKIVESCVRRGVAPGSHSRGIDQAKILMQHGVRFLGCGNDTSMLYERASEIVRALI